MSIVDLEGQMSLQLLETPELSEALKAIF